MYCTRDDLIERFGTKEIEDLEYGRPNAVAEALTDADGFINGYLASRYPLPLTAVPALLKRIARDLVRYSLDNDPSDVISKRRDEAVNYLKGLSKGEVTLGLPVESEPDSLDTAEIQSDGHVFRRTDKSFI